METVFTAYIFTLAAITGACIGSFVNVVAYRLPKGIFFADKYSHCPECRERLHARDLIPVLSWFLLGGRCRYCAAAIPRRYVIVEILCAVFAVCAVLRWGFVPYTAVVFCVIAVLVAIALIDRTAMMIPDTLNIALIPFAIAAVWLQCGGVTLFARAAGFFAVSLPMLLIALMIRGAFGGGDIKLMAVMGFFLGWQGILLAFFIALLTGGSYAIYLMMSGRAKRGDRMAFGPYLCTGLTVSIFYGTQIIRLYLSLFMP